jgi:hypothetical protein
MAAPKPVPAPSPTRHPTTPSVRSGMAQNPKAPLPPTSIPTETARSIARNNREPIPGRRSEPKRLHSRAFVSRFRTHPDLRIPRCRATRNVPTENCQTADRASMPIDQKRRRTAPGECHAPSRCHSRTAPADWIQCGLPDRRRWIRRNLAKP